MRKPLVKNTSRNKTRICNKRCSTLASSRVLRPTRNTSFLSSGPFIVDKASEQSNAGTTVCFLHERRCVLTRCLKYTINRLTSRHQQRAAVCVLNKRPLVGVACCVEIEHSAFYTYPFDEVLGLGILITMVKSESQPDSHSEARAHGSPVKRGASTEQ